MAVTRRIPMHMNKGKTISQSLSDRTDYAKNPEKTDKGELVMIPMSPMDKSYVVQTAIGADY